MESSVSFLLISINLSLLCSERFAPFISKFLIISSVNLCCSELKEEYSLVLIALSFLNIFSFRNNESLWAESLGPIFSDNLSKSSLVSADNKL